MRNYGWIAPAAFLLIGVPAAVAQYINGPAAPVTADQFCAKFQRFVGSSSDGHSLLSLSCRGGGHDFYLHARIN